MKILERNKLPFWYLLYQGKSPVVDSEGYKTSEDKPIYDEAVRMRASISQATGNAQIQPFGSFVDYDKVIVTDDLDCPINENTVLFLDREPEYSDDGTPQYDYIVRRVARSLNFISIAASKVKVS